ncbi:hypothetical protein C1H46_027247 [Malus baccata]|uniref:UDP-glycosyltransferases domain-containing protein n=1 Tax=Malus baccata TaxID=106549 RepID=A0A540LLQ6_MALBA|nr:hypothetical protein C1H46_027247 [Malus baccata]
MAADSGSVLQTPETHVVLLPSSQMGHLTPMLRLAALLLAQNYCPLRLTLITAHPTVSLAESALISRFLSAYHDRVTHLQFHPFSIDPSTANSTDPFWIQFEVIRRSAHLLTPLLSTLSPPASALIYDISLLSPVVPPLFQYLHGPNLQKLAGVLIFTFEALEAEGPEAISGGSPPVFSVGPFVPCEFEKLPAHGDGDQCGGDPGQPQPFEWLNEQPDGSVVYVAFGSKTALSSEQIREVGDGLEKSRFRFLWVVKEKMVDSEEEGGEGNLSSGRVLSHSGWNSVVEAAWHGVRDLAWPQNGDQKVVAEVAEICGLGIWEKSWPWSGDREKKLVKGDEIAVKIKELMESDSCADRRSG